MATDKIEQALSKLGPDEKDIIILPIIEAAAEYFEECPDDFCLQHASYDRIIFGGTNRLIWSVKYGFTADRPYCSNRFLAHYDQLKKKGE